MPIKIKARLEYLREQIENECISYGEIAELTGLKQFIEPGDVQLLEWAGVDEQATTHLNIVTCGNCGRVFGHDNLVGDILTCPYCGFTDDKSSFPDLYTMPNHKDSYVNILK